MILKKCECSQEWFQNRHDFLSHQFLSLLLSVTVSAVGIYSIVITADVEVTDFLSLCVQDVSNGFVLCSPENLCHTGRIFDAQVRLG